MSRKQNEEIQKTVLELKKTTEQFKYLEEQFKAKKQELQQKIRSYMQKNNFAKFHFVSLIDNKQVQFNVSDVVSRKVTFDVDKLEEKLDKEILNEIIIKKYSITDYPGLIAYLKQCGVNPKQFKEYIQVDKSVDTKKLDRLSETGEINLEDIKGCYEVKESEGYIRLSESEVKTETGE